MASFWGVEVAPGKTHTSTLEFDLHLRNVALGVSAKEGERVIVSVHHGGEKKSFVLASLRLGQVEQVALDLHFPAGDKVGFSIQGSTTATVHLTGNLMQDISSDFEDDDIEPSEKRQELRSKLAGYLDDEADEGSEDDSEEEDELEEDELEEDDEDSDAEPPVLSSKRKPEEKADTGAKKPKQEAPAAAKPHQGEKPKAAPHQADKPKTAADAGTPKKSQQQQQQPQQGGKAQGQSTTPKPAGGPKPQGGQATPKPGGAPQQSPKQHGAPQHTPKQGGGAHTPKQGDQPAPKQNTPKQGDKSKEKLNKMLTNGQ